jgi:hypothetical protein
VRHPDEKIMMYPADSQGSSTSQAEYIREGVGVQPTVGCERTGVLHLLHAWRQQAHKVSCYLFCLHIYIDK